MHPTIEESLGNFWSWQNQSSEVRGVERAEEWQQNSSLSCTGVADYNLRGTAIHSDILWPVSEAVRDPGCSVEVQKLFPLEGRMVLKALV